ncbi:helix-turn-helix domain-containing protein [Sediminibacterium sp.]|uniref:helix-turn-helix domain-containing protein n=1 Tax=Sediminibacterium sp. TaxID=1917865 RepID=UPI00344DAFBD
MKRPRYLSVHVVAQRLGISTRSVLRLIDSGELPAWRPGQRAWQVSELDLANYIARRGGNIEARQAGNSPRRARVESA